ncbi:large subunit ribosomal protein L32 [Lewinella marina]|uniref:Large ribosomal subunit protein bL32 n=1 Tax=Neolewinella marina TaxID=438751 RepID=A0A2G0CHZ6_9BACT|nr:50S ribosomal protein L32 [Neolewinella marina]NJB85306.1 large subunit ribosomal protein L32 [Neolewinella marina]PHK99578.1 50S ribosomal protein L32 [Neolewinella marina]
MAHPKSRISKQRKRKRRTHYKATAPTLTTCQTTGELHQPHRAYKDSEGNLFYNGNLIVKAPEVIVADTTEDTEEDN